MQRIAIIILACFLTQVAAANSDYDKLAFNLLLREVLEQYVALNQPQPGEKKPSKISVFWHVGATTPEDLLQTTANTESLQHLIQQHPSYDADRAWPPVAQWYQASIQPVSCQSRVETLRAKLVTNQSIEQSSDSEAFTIPPAELGCASLNLAIETLTSKDRLASLLQWLEQIDRWRPDTTHTLLLTWLQIRQHNYPMALRYNYRLVWHSPQYRFTYEAIQWLYSHQEKGNGSVALRKP